MGLQRTAGSTTYLHTSRQGNGLEIIAIDGSLGYISKLDPSSNEVIKWSKNIQKTPQEYLTALVIALEATATGLTEKNVEENIFEIHENCLLWKQFFPQQNLYGRRGKFSLEKLKSETAMGFLLERSFQDQILAAQTVKGLTNQNEALKKEHESAMKLAEKSVTAKKEFEDNVYRKMSMLLNSKKIRIRQLMENTAHGSNVSIKDNSSLLINNESKSSTMKAMDETQNSDGCYDSDTDVDEPSMMAQEDDEMDTDEEKEVRLSPLKINKGYTSGSKIGGKSKSSQKRLLDSQEDLFNDSLDLDLGPLDEKKEIKIDHIPKKSISEKERLGFAKARKESSDSEPEIIEINSKNKTSRHNNSKNIQTQKSLCSIKNNSSNVLETPNSIFDELF